jgi:hypothetical protein
MKLLEGDGGSGSGNGLLIEGFDKHSPTGSTITAQAQTLGTSIGDVENFDATITSQHNTATEGLTGMIADDLADAPTTAKNQAIEVVQGTTVAAGAMTNYGTAIDTFNGRVDGWNSTIAAKATAEEQRETKSGLTSQYTGAVEDLETAANTCKKQLEDPLNPNYIKTLFLAGALPVRTPAIFRNLELDLSEEEIQLVRAMSEYRLGPPVEPYIEWDEDFEYDSADAGLDDWRLRLKWLAMLRGAQVGRSDLDDATLFYEHYWDNNGEPIEFDYEEAYNEDSGVRRQVDAEIARTRAVVEGYLERGHTDFSISGPPTPTGQGEYPTTENWQKAIGGHQAWSSADVTVDGNEVTMTIAVHGRDHYNFNAGQGDIATGASDDENGRFTEVGWAKPFDSYGEITRTVTWTIGESDSTITDSGDPARNPGREDREDERGSGDPDRPARPDNDRDTGRRGP